MVGLLLLLLDVHEGGHCSISLVRVLEPADQLVCKCLPILGVLPGLDLTLPPSLCSALEQRQSVGYLLLWRPSHHTKKIRHLPNPHLRVIMCPP